MKKFMKLTMLSLLMAGGAQAQVATIPEIWQPLDIGLCALPKAYSTDGKAKLVYYESLEEGGNIKINVYNSSFNVEHSFEVAPQSLVSKTVREERAIVSTPVGDFEYFEPSYISIDNGWWETETITQAERIEVLKHNARYLWGDSAYTETVQKGDDVYFYYYGDHRYTGQTCLKGIFLLNGTTLKVQNMDNFFKTGEWEITDESEYTNEYYLDVIWNSCDLDNYDNREQGLPLLVTQTFFNTDAKYEYLRYKYVETHSIEDEADTDSDGIIDKRYVRDGYKCVGIEVVSEDGNVLTSFDVGEIYSPEILLWGGKRYIILESDTDGYIIYEINPTGNGVTRVNSENFMHILPAMPRQNTIATVELSEESAKNGGQLVITNMSGRTVYQQVVNPGETSVQLPLRRISSGAYNVTLLNCGRKVESSKLIIR